MKKLILSFALSFISLSVFAQQKIPIDTIRFGNLQQYMANSIVIEDFHIDNATLSSIKLHCSLLDTLIGGGSIRVPDDLFPAFDVIVPVNPTLTLGAIIVSCKTAVLGYSPLFKTP